MLPATLPSSANVVRLAHQTLLQPEGDPVLTASTEAWRLLLELAWSYPRLWYAVWAHLMARPPRTGTER